MRLYLVRHGQTAWNEAGRAQGHTDIPLDATGLRQAEAVGEAFREIPLDRILTSDLQRAHQTAAPISDAAGVPLTIRRDLRERSFGDWEGNGFTDVAAWALERSIDEAIHLLEVRPPNGESFADVWNRLDAVVDDLNEMDGRVAIVTHGGTCGVLLARLTRGSLETTRSFRFGNTGVTELERRADGYYVIQRYNDVTHLAAHRPLAGSVDGTHR
ncbi:MAG: histidine phosphatase family protein [Fimbriimonas sp.]